MLCYTNSFSGMLFHKEELDSKLPSRTANLRSLLSGAHAGSWLSGSPSSAMTKFSPPEFQCLLRWRLGIPFASPSRFCNGCGSLQDPLGDHALSCHALGLYTRHNFLRDEFVSQLHKVGLNAYPNGDFPGNPGIIPRIFLLLMLLMQDNPWHWTFQSCIL